jgi:hypothetical protein
MMKTITRVFLTSVRSHVYKAQGSHHDNTSNQSPTEAARAIRKKLKYGTVHRQLRALTLLDAMLLNGDRKVKSMVVELNRVNGSWNCRR